MRPRGPRRHCGFESRKLLSLRGPVFPRFEDIRNSSFWLYPGGKGLDQSFRNCLSRSVGYVNTGDDMRKLLFALGLSVVGTLGTAFAAQAAVIDFGATEFGNVTFLGTSLSQSTSLTLSNPVLLVSTVGPDDTTGLAPGTSVTLSVSTIGYGGGPFSLTKTWTIGGDTYTETLTSVASINRATVGSIAVTLKGTVSDTLGTFVDTPATMILSATQAKGAVSFSFTDAATTVPEPSTWAMLLIGFMGLGYAAFRRNAKSHVEPIAL